jgi:uncharacterized 2Fe-2S/4Fe-4S cluster protein (DUF4445 family)
LFEVKFLPSGQTARVADGTTILNAARSTGLVIESPCGEKGTCGKCKVRLDDVSLANVIQGGFHRLSASEEALGYVLSCEAKIQGDITVDLLKQQENKTLKILDHGKSFDIELDTYIKKNYIKEQNITKVFASQQEQGSEDGDTTQRNYGVVIDIGTTTLVASLVDFDTGAELNTTSVLNPQAIYAQDVLSRINFASEESGLATLYTELIREINGMIFEITNNSGVSKDNIYEVIFSGNTCMLHLATGVNPYSLGKYPYTPEISGGQYIKAHDLNLSISEFGLVYLPPIISAYVGADITSGILATKLYDRKGKALFVDIGTNGEMAVGVDGKLSATSTAAGPAFEGMNITFGMRAGAGAIEFFNIENNGTVTIKTIGDINPNGICGSGLLDIVGELVAHGVINKNGKFVSPESPDITLSLRERLVPKDGKTVFMVSDGVYLTQKDVRQVQLAKGAVRAGIEFLLESKSINAHDVDKILIAGSFGYHLRAKSLINIGLLPTEFEGKIEFIGNTSKSGGTAFLLNQTYRHDMEQLVSQVEVIELSSYKDFDKVFVKCLGF